MCLLPPRELELQHTVRYTVRVHEPERCRALSASFVRKTLGESERSGGECRLRAISDIVVISESAHTSPPGFGSCGHTRPAQRALTAALRSPVRLRPPGPHHATRPAARSDVGVCTNCAHGTRPACTPHRRGCTILRDTLPGRHTHPVLQNSELRPASWSTLMQAGPTRVTRRARHRVTGLDGTGRTARPDGMYHGMYGCS